MDGPIRAFAGITGGGGRGRGRGDGGAKDVQKAAPPPVSTADRAKLRESQLARCAQLRKIYNDAGVNFLRRIG